MLPKSKAVGLETQLLLSVCELLNVHARQITELIAGESAGFETHALDAMVASGLTTQEVEEICAIYDLQHYKSQQPRVLYLESIQLLRVARVLALAEIVLESRESALRWLRQPREEFGGASALVSSSTEEGVHRVEELLGQASSR
jgi:uncharacterized protein (DUF2384 family)